MNHQRVGRVKSSEIWPAAALGERRAYEWGDGNDRDAWHSLSYGRHGYVTHASHSCQDVRFLHERCKGVTYPFAQGGHILTTVIPQKCGIHAIAGAAWREDCCGAVTAGLARFLVLWTVKVHGMDCMLFIAPKSLT